MTEQQGQINRYTCKHCRKTIVTVNRDEGTTPAFTDCPHCPRGVMVSHWYNVPQTTDGFAIVYEWYRPPKKRWRKLDPFVRDHVEQGGLLLRKQLPPQPERPSRSWARRRRRKSQRND